MHEIVYWSGRDYLVRQSAHREGSLPALVLASAPASTLPTRLKSGSLRDLGVPIARLQEGWLGDLA